MSDIVIYGRGKTGQSIKEMLQRLHISAKMYDDATGFDEGGKFTENGLVLVSPGVPPYAKGIAEAKKSGAVIVGELEFCFALCHGKCISVTGTNGKTTTCEMIYSVLQNSGIKSLLLGNGGVPFSSRVLDVTDEIVVLESSSFQLYGCLNFAPYVSVFTSLAPDHLNWHGDFESYKKAKLNNFLHQKEGYAIFNYDDENVRELSALCRCKKLFYSLYSPEADCYFDGNAVFLREGNRKIKTALNRFPRHVASDALAATLACNYAGVDPSQSLYILENFQTLPHRLQRVDEFDGVSFYDDSKATNVHATLSALKCFSQNLALIVGGSDKGEEFDAIFETLTPNVKAVVAVGQTAEKFRLCGQRHGYFVAVAQNFKEAAKLCYRMFLPTGGVVLMSNACASFDGFNGYAERGEYFAKAVEELKSESQKT